MNERTETCSTCEMWKRYLTDDPQRLAIHGSCHYAPPTWINDGPGAHTCKWPTTRADDFCAHHYLNAPPVDCDAPRYVAVLPEGWDDDLEPCTLRIAVQMTHEWGIFDVTAERADDGAVVFRWPEGLDRDAPIHELRVATRPHAVPVPLGAITAGLGQGAAQAGTDYAKRENLRQQNRELAELLEDRDNELCELRAARDRVAHELSALIEQRDAARDHTAETAAHLEAAERMLQAPVLVELFDKDGNRQTLICKDTGDGEKTFHHPPAYGAPCYFPELRMVRVTPAPAFA